MNFNLDPQKLKAQRVISTDRVLFFESLTQYSSFSFSLVQFTKRGTPELILLPCHILTNLTYI